jgi:hypothetical protein
LFGCAAIQWLVLTLLGSFWYVEDPTITTQDQIWLLFAMFVASSMISIHFPLDLITSEDS